MSKKDSRKRTVVAQSLQGVASRTLNLSAFVRDFKESIDQDTRYCFILGSGASYTSGVPTGAILVDNWIADMHRTQAPDEPDTDRQAWAEKILPRRIPSFTWTTRADFYGHIYRERFPDNAIGQAALRKLMERKVPAFGYTVLARILATTPHNLLITTNFDDLAHDALTQLSCRPPFIAHSHEEAKFLDLHDRRCRIIKIHGDIDRETYNVANQIDKLHGDWIEPLRRLLGSYTPIFLGYGGCDPGFMNFLTDVYQPSLARPRPIWAYRVDGSALNAGPHLADDPPGKPATGLCNAFLHKHNGWWLPTPGFDELMLLLGHALKIGHGGRSIRAAAEVAATAYQETLITALKTARNHDGSAWCPQLDYLTKLAEQDLLGEAKLRRWEEWSEYIDAATTLAEERSRCDDAIEERPEDARVYARLAWALNSISPSDPEVDEALNQAKKLLKGLAVESQEALYILNVEATCWLRRGRADEAKSAFRQLVEKHTSQLGPEHPDTLASRNNLANALSQQNEIKEAERERRAVLEIRERVLGSEHLQTLRSRNNLANSLQTQDRHPEAEALYREMLAIQERVLGIVHPDIFQSCFNLALCLAAQNQDKEAMGFAQRALVGWQNTFGPNHERTSKAQALVNRLSGEAG